MESFAMDFAFRFAFAKLSSWLLCECVCEKKVNQMDIPHSADRNGKSGVHHQHKNLNKILNHLSTANESS